MPEHYDFAQALADVWGGATNDLAEPLTVSSAAFHFHLR
jgi:hypothetical protein